MPYLTYEEDGQTRLVHLNQGQRTVIGRCKSSDIALASNPKASRNHCAVYYYPEGRCFALTDLRSTNGTTLNGLRISTDVIVSEGDEIGVGGMKLTFHTGEENVADAVRKEAVKTAEAVKAFGLNDISNLDHTQSFKIPADMAQDIKLEFGVQHEFEFDEGSFIGDHKVQKKIADTQMAATYVVRSPEAEQDSALKIFKKTIEGEKAEQEFLDTIQSAAKIQHAGFIRYLEAGVHHGHCYYVAEYLESPNLAKRISRKAPFLEIECLETVRSIGMSLDYAFDAYGLFHRNLKPSNVLYTKNDTPAIADYGIAIWESKNLAGGVSIASPWYISPEQIVGKRIDWQADLYSLGVILFQMLTGVLPFHSTIEEELLGMHLEMGFPEPHERNPNVRVSPATCDVLRKMTAKDPSKRFESWEAFSKAVDANITLINNSTGKFTPFLPDKTAGKVGEQLPWQTHVKRKKLSFRK